MHRRREIHVSTAFDAIIRSIDISVFNSSTNLLLVRSGPFNNASSLTSRNAVIFVNEGSAGITVSAVLSTATSCDEQNCSQR